MAVRVFVAGGNALYRRGLVAMLSESAELEVLAHADGRALLHPDRWSEADVLVIVTPAELDEVIERLRSFRKAGGKVVVCAERHQERHLADRLGFAFDALLSTETPLEEFQQAVKLVLAGFLVLPTSVGGLLEVLAGAVPTLERADGLPRLTPREREVLHLLAAGLSNAEIAKALGISLSGARDHVSRLLKALGQPNRIMAVQFAKRVGLLEPDRRTAPDPGTHLRGSLTAPTGSVD